MSGGPCDICRSLDLRASTVRGSTRNSEQMLDVAGTRVPVASDTTHRRCMRCLFVRLSSSAAADSTYTRKIQRIQIRRKMLLMKNVFRVVAIFGSHPATSMQNLENVEPTSRKFGSGEVDSTYKAGMQ
jgi:hypothetical protein